MVVTASCVNCRVVPPAPYVTDANAGFSGASTCTVSQSRNEASRDCGGKNSKLTRGVVMEDILFVVPLVPDFPT